jgi:ferric-dicitrate binding protein FerR (iron transport regulator)
MSDEKNTKGARRSPPASDDTIARLLRLAGPRPSVPDERSERVKEAVRSRWSRNVKVRRMRIRLLIAALPVAAALVVAFFLRSSTSVPSTDTPAPTVAHIEAATGSGAQILGTGETQLIKPVIGDSIVAGTTVLTGADGRAAFHLAGGASLRLDMGSRVRLLSSSEMLLENGAVYVDNEAIEGDKSAVEVFSRLGVVRDVGTQFEVRLAEQSLRLRVREGTVILDSEGGTEVAEVGTELIRDAEGGLVRRSVSVYGPEWNWVVRVAPVFEIEGRRLDDFLSWISRETGRGLSFQGDETAGSVSDIVLHGSIEGLTPEEALATVLPTCGLTHRVREGMILIGELGTEMSWR